jgi:hypothetical protein
MQQAEGLAVLIYVSNESTGEVFYSRAYKYMLGEQIKRLFVAHSSESFNDLTRNYRDWHILITDPEVLEADPNVLHIIERDKGMLVCLLRDSPNLKLADTVLWEEDDPDPADAWLAMMYRLLRLAGEPRDRGASPGK